MANGSTRATRRKRERAAPDADKVKACIDALRPLVADELQRVQQPIALLVDTLWGGDKTLARRAYSTDVNFYAVCASNELVGTSLTKTTLHAYLRVYLQEDVIPPELAGTLKLGQRVAMIKAKTDEAAMRLATQVVDREASGGTVSARDVAAMVRADSPPVPRKPSTRKQLAKVLELLDAVATVRVSDLDALDDQELLRLSLAGAAVKRLQVLVDYADWTLKHGQFDAAPVSVTKKPDRVVPPAPVSGFKSLYLPVRGRTSGAGG